MNHRQALKQEVFKIIGKSADELQVDAYVIGGFVRDYFLQRGDAKDIDIVAVGSGIELAQKVSSQLMENPKVSVFKNFGTAMIKHGDIELEFVGARKESYTCNSRKPIVENGTLADDQNRRDFTINALALSLNERDFGNLLDPFDGIGDLEKKLLGRLWNPELLIPMIL